MGLQGENESKRGDNEIHSLIGCERFLVETRSGLWRSLLPSSKNKDSQNCSSVGCFLLMVNAPIGC